MKAEEFKLIVQEKYGEIARQSLLQTGSSCCGTSGCCGDPGFTMMSDDYQSLDGYHPDADLGLGCGLPTLFSGINKGDHVLDLGSGAGNDCFVARALTGKSGWVTGLDFTEEMIDRAQRNAWEVGYDNVEFVRGDIEKIPLPDNRYDVVISNCVLNLVPDKSKAFSEIYRVLKPGGHFCVSDVVVKGSLPENIRNDAEMYVGCVAGALDMKEYLGIISSLDFQNVTLHKQSEIVIPDSVLEKSLTPEEIKNFRDEETGIFSITVSASKKE